MKTTTKHIFSFALTLFFISCCFFFTGTAEAQGSYLCPDGSYADTSFDCPVYTCPGGSTVGNPADCPAGTLCGDGSTVYPPDQCPSGTLCWDGSTVYPPDTCPVQMQTCPDGTVIPITDTCPSTDSCGGVDRPNDNQTRECCRGNSVTNTGEGWCIITGAQRCRDRNICGSDPSPSAGGTCSGTDQVCAVSIVNSCSNNGQCDTAIHCLDGTTVYPPDTCPDGGTCPDSNGVYADSCPLYQCPDGVTSTHDETLSDCPQSQTCSDGRIIYPPATCNTTQVCSYQVTVQYGARKLLYTGIYSKTIPIAQTCVLPTEAQILEVMQYTFDPLPDQVPPAITPYVSIDPIDQCPGADFPGDQSVSDFISGGYRRDANGNCVLDGTCSTTVNTCTSALGATDISEGTSTDGVYTYNWTCPGQYGGNDASCSKASSATNGSCSSLLDTCTTGTPTPVPATLSGGVYNWSCQGTNGGTNATCTGCNIGQEICGGVCVNTNPCGHCSTSTLCPNGSCIPQGQVCQTATTTLITTFNMIPHIVASSTELCQATWSASIPQDNQGNYVGGCTLNGIDVPPSSSAAKAPGTYTFRCETSGVSQAQTSRCEVNPLIRER